MTSDRVIIGFMVISVIIGVVLQRSRWCVVRALREPWMSGDSTAAVAIIGGILAGMIGMAAYKFSYGDPIDMVFVFPHFWLRGLIGGTIFGIGMVLAGGCAVGSMWRAAEGQVKLMISLFAMIFTMPLVAKYVNPGFLELLPDDLAEKKVYLPDEMGYGLSILLVVGLLALWYWFAKWNDLTKKFAAF